jgi:chromosome segregation ATPase
VSATEVGAPNKALINVPGIPARKVFTSVGCALSCLANQGERRETLSYEDYEQEGLRARAEQALGELAQALIDNPTLHDAVTAALGAREKALEAQQAAMSALNLPSATDVERLERRLRSFSQRLEDVEEAIDDLSRELGAIRRENAKQEDGRKAKKKAESKPQA